MKHENRAIILIQLLEKQENLKFQSELLAFLQEQCKSSDTIFSLDNFSDGITTQYAVRLLDESDKVIIVCDIEGDPESLGPAMTILNKGMKKDVDLYANKELKILKPFMKQLRGKVFKTVNELNIA